MTTDAKHRRVRYRLAVAVATLDELKVSTGCADCGYNAHPAALHFDHTDPMTKRVDLGWRDDRSRLTSQARLDRYLEHVRQYCVIRCANCHAARSATEKHWQVRRDGDAVLLSARDWPTLFDGVG